MVLVQPVLLSVVDVNVTGLSTFKNNVHLLDNDELEFGGAEGATGDLRIVHNGTDSKILNSTGLT